MESLSINWYTESIFLGFGIESVDRRVDVMDGKVNAFVELCSNSNLNSSKQRRIVKLLMISSGYRIISGRSNYYTRIIHIEFQNKPPRWFANAC